ncbi:ABC transporter ATP-binding protein [Candidatus Bathyarchaeota archaeon]|nr:ABC transporter ATP-binding protein [Candidatus Bathyarchaeota archaeon]
MNVIEAQNLSRIYRLKNGGEVKAVDNVNLLVPEGQFLTIIGASGSGKTTLLNLLGGLDKPTAGRIVVEGVDLSDLGEEALVRFRRKKVGFVFQAFNLIPTLTAVENVEAALAPTGMPKAERFERSMSLLELVGLKGQVDRLPVALSAGEQQRVAIARAFANEPQVLLLDEPTGNLDTVTGKEIMRLCHKASKERGQTVVAVTHAGYVKEYTDRLLYMKDGKFSNTVPEGELEEPVS